MIGKELNFERTTGSFKTVLLIDDTGYFEEQFESYKDQNNRWTLFNEEDEGLVPYTGILGRVIGDVSVKFDSEVWRQIIPSINIAYKIDVERYGIQTFNYILNMFPHHYTYDRTAQDGDLSEPVKFNNTTLSSTYTVQIQHGSTGASNFGYSVASNRICAGGGVFSSLSINNMSISNADATITIYFRIYPSSIIDENGLIDFSNINHYYNVIVGFGQYKSLTNQTTRFSFVVDKSTETGVYQLVDKGVFVEIEANTVSTDPYDDGGTSNSGGGNGTFDPSGDTIGVPNLPSISAIDTGFVSIWKPTKTELKNLYNYLWSGLDLNTLKKIFANPIDTIMGFSIIPLTPTTGTAKELKIGNIGTGIYITPVVDQYYEIDCGTITIPEFFGSYLDYEPYTTIDLYLPYIGSVRISTDDIKRNPPNNGTIQLIYHIDILSGSCVVFVVTNGTVSYQYNGSILTQLPITGNDFTSTINSVLGLTSNIVGGVMSASTGNAAGVLGNSVNAAHNVTSAKPTINRSGNISGSGGFLGVQKPFLIMNLPKQAIAFAQNTFTGYPAHITNSVKSLTGYTEFEQIWIQNVPATESELSEIESILTSGVIL